jgi:hypothetical protein
MTKSTQKHKRPIRRHKSQKPRLLKGGEIKIENGGLFENPAYNAAAPNGEETYATLPTYNKNERNANIIKSMSKADSIGKFLHPILKNNVIMNNVEECNSYFDNETQFRNIMEIYVIEYIRLLNLSKKLKNERKFVFDETLVDGLINGYLRIYDEEKRVWKYTNLSIKDFLKNMGCTTPDDDDDDDGTSAGGRLSRRKRKNYTKRRKRCTTTTRRRQRRKRSTKYYK